MFLMTLYKMFRSATGKEISNRELVTIRVLDYVETTAIAFGMFLFFVPVARALF